MKKRLLACLLAACMAVSMLVLPASAVSLNNSAIQTAITLGAMDTSQTGSLDAAVTRGAFAKMLVSFSAYRESAAQQGNIGTLYKDVPGTSQWAPYVRIAVQQGWMNGYTDGTFRPDNTVTLEEACTAALKLLGYKMTELNGVFPMAQLTKAQELGLRNQLEVVKSAKERLAGYLQNETQTERNLELLEEACGLLDMESDAEDEEEEETEWEQISQCVEEMENLEPVDSGPKDKKKAAALDRLEELFDKELLDILLPAGTAISQNAVSLKGIPSASKYQNDTESSDTEGTGLLEAASRQMAVNAYVPLYFYSFLKENESEPSALRYEMEYLLAGKKSDRENLKDAVNQVLTLRGAMNLLFLLNSPDKKAEADALAAAVAVGIVPAQMALSFFILTLWAFGEAVLDVKMLLAGGKIPFWKTEGTWKTCLSGLLDQSFLKETGESSGDGRTYTEYLSCLIFLMDRKTRNFRMMDLIQWNIRTEQADFSVANCAYQIEIEAEVLQKHMFFQKEEYKGTVYVAGSY